MNQRATLASLGLVLLALSACGGSTALATSSTGGSGGKSTDAGTGGSGGSSADSSAGGSSSGVVTGRACTTASDCGTGYTCNTQAPGGYCMEGTVGGPKACSGPDYPCTAPGAMCSPLPWSQISGVCLRACASAADCRTGYQCAVVQVFPGDPTSPQSPGTVCWTACQPGVDPSCNDNPVISSLHGVCQADGTCKCNDGYQKNPVTGRCL